VLIYRVEKSSLVPEGNLSMRQYELMLFPRLHPRTAILGGYFDTLADALDEARKHPESEYEVRDHHHDERLAASSGHDPETAKAVPHHEPRLNTP
jgi:hypothetical protein